MTNLKFILIIAALFILFSIALFSGDVFIALILGACMILIVGIPPDKP